MYKKHLVLSAVNLTEGGPLTILLDCLATAKRLLLPEWRITVLVHNANLVNSLDVNVISFPKIKSSWIRRIIFEWWQLRSISNHLGADLWISLHDITPIVRARRHVVYCHNATPFYKLHLHDFIYSPKLVLMRLFYGTLYGVNIKKNDFLIVQQEWLRNAFLHRYGIKNVIVAHPNLTINSTNNKRLISKNNFVCFFYPALPRPFKNHAILFAAALLLWNRGVRNFEINITVNSEENNYINSLNHRYLELPCMRYLGRLPYDDVQSWYQKCNALLFPSTLETWGLPISEAKTWNIPIITSDLPYAHETVGNYDNVKFCEPNNAEQWAEQMLSLIEGRWKPDQVSVPAPSEPYSENWSDLLLRITHSL
jgi:glycosyltransferase involved in cell wall biosynthesis